MENGGYDAGCEVNELTSSTNDSRNAAVSGTNVSSESNEVNKPDEVVRDSNSVPYLYREDVVMSKTGVIGIVSEVSGDSDSDSSITDDEDEDEDEDEEDDGNNDSSNVNENVDSNNGSGESNYKCGSLQPDQVRVQWMDDTEPVQNINDLTVVDRGFLHGDFVASASDPTGQVGVVVDVNVSCDLLLPDESVFKGVPSRGLNRVRDFVVGDHVVLGAWLGRVDDVLDNVTVLIDDGSVCKVFRADPLHLQPISKSTLEADGNFPYYPGQRVKASSSSVFKNSRWLSGLWKANRLEGTVTKVTTGSVFVYWIASAGYGPDSSTPPAEEQSPKNLKLLSCFAHANWQLGDWCLLPPLPSNIKINQGLSKLKINESVKAGQENSQMESGFDSEEVVQEESIDNSDYMDLNPGEGNETINSKSSPESSSCGSSLSVSKEPARDQLRLSRKKIRKVTVKSNKKARKKEESIERALLIVNTKTTVDVAWQDGTTGYELDATSLIPVDNPGDHEFVAEQYVVERASDDDEDTSQPRRVGVVKSVNAKERTACVKWLKPVARPEDPREFEKVEIVSVYELEGHPDYDYCYGDVVVRLSPVSLPVQPTTGKDTMEAPKQQKKADDLRRDIKKCSRSKKEEDTSGEEAGSDFSDLSWVGNITGLKNGDIEVTWANGMVSMVGPQAIYVVGRDDDDESIAAGSEVSDDAASWETVNDDEMDVLENAQEEEEAMQSATNISIETDEIPETDSGRNSALSLAIGFVTRLASGIFSRGRKSEDQLSSDSRDENEFVSQGMSDTFDSTNDSSSGKRNFVDDYGVESTDGKEEEHTAEGASETLSAEVALRSVKAETSEASVAHEVGISSFRRFDIVADPLDHNFLGANGQNNNRRKWFKKVQQDWSILQNNLPDGIYVRVYEDRMDLLRAAIVGAYGTPYQEGLFFFDFHLPPEYPDVPPSAYYHSGGWRINPNLYEEGKVCLSLLNTWTGKGNEVWDPASSSILQVLVSLQGLVLNSKPYFNEAGYDKQVGTAEGEKNSLGYNENTFLLNCKSMMYLMRRPPKDFEELIKDHFKRRGYYILKACDAYMQGCLIGSLTKDASASVHETADLTSVGFKLMLAKIVPKLFVALKEVGADCEEFKHLQQS